MQRTAFATFVTVLAIGLLAAAEPIVRPEFSQQIGASVFVRINDATFGSHRQPTSIKTAAGEFFLDVANNPVAEQELIQHSVPTHGDLRQTLVTVSGTLEFRRLKDDPKGELRHVIVVKSLKIRLGYPGDRTGPFPLD